MANDTWREELRAKEWANLLEVSATIRKRGPMAGGVFKCGTKALIASVWNNGVALFRATNAAESGDAYALAEAWNALPGLVDEVVRLRRAVLK